MLRVKNYKRQRRIKVSIKTKGIDCTNAGEGINYNIVYTSQINFIRFGKFSLIHAL